MSGYIIKDWSDIRISEILWPEDRINHIGRHNVNPIEVQEVCFGKPLILRTKGQGVNPVYLVLGQTAQGRYLTCVLVNFADGKGYPVTARDMTDKERKRFQKWRGK